MSERIYQLCSKSCGKYRGGMFCLNLHINIAQLKHIGLTPDIWNYFKGT